MIEFNNQVYVVVGSRDEAHDLVCRSCENFLGAPLVGYADFTEWQGGTYGVDEARVLREKQNRSGVANQAKFFLVVADSLTHEAQNALLKTLEEPADQAFIFILLPTLNNVLDTLLSRVELVRVGSIKNNLEDLAISFLASKPAERIDMIEEIIGKGLPGLPQTGHPDRAKARAFVAELAKVFRQKNDPKNWSAEQIFAVEELVKTEQYLTEPASLAKMILEHLALILPVNAL